MAPLWVREGAAWFWAAAGEVEGFPRTLHAPIAFAVPVSVVLQARLHVAGVEQWLQTQGVPGGLTVRDRPLRACLVARRGHGLIFLDGADPENERRFSLAHELAHFLLDYWLPRQHATRRVGPDALAILDGDRTARDDERIHAALARVALHAHTHLLARGEAGMIVDPAVMEAERRADHLAYELLAPADAVRALLPPDANRIATAHVLTGAFGLPASIAEAYAAILVPAEPAPPSLLRRLGLT